MLSAGLKPMILCSGKMLATSATMMVQPNILTIDIKYMIRRDGSSAPKT